MDSKYEFAGDIEPVKRVKTQADLVDWYSSTAYYDLLGFINGISTAIQGKKITDDIYVSEKIKNLLDVFDKLNALIDESPPTEQPQRFGNKAYRTWSSKMYHDIFMLLQKAVPQEKCHLISELGFYLCESFGNAVRIDYGTGHELSFIFFLCALFKGEILEEADSVACALRLFNAYLLFVRRLQKIYRMEPAGSQGVWSLDDYQFVPFIWGSAQLAYRSPFDPAKFLDENIINDFKEDYMFIGCIDYICQVKTGHFAEHSNQLWSISAVPSWAKINSGLVKMYSKEILSKYPIIQHVLFGKLMSFNPVKPGTTIRNARLGFPPTSKTSLQSSAEMPPPPVPSDRSVSSDESVKDVPAEASENMPEEEYSPSEEVQSKSTISEDVDSVNS